MSSYWRNKSEIVQAVSTESDDEVNVSDSKTSTSHNVVILDSDAVPVFEHYIFILLIVVATADLKTGTD